MYLQYFLDQFLLNVKFFIAKGRKFMSKTFSKISIIGLGYVGLPLSIQFVALEYNVLGLDQDSKKVDSINSGKSYLRHYPSKIIAEQVNDKKFEATTDPSRLSEIEAVIICVPTPLNDHREPDLSFVLETASYYCPSFKQRSTSYS